MRRATGLLIPTATLALLCCYPAMAYVGPGAGITILGALWSVILAIALAIGAVLFWPIRVLIRRRRNRASKAANERAGASEPGRDN